MSQTRIVIIPPAASMPAPFLIFDATGRVLLRGSLRLNDPIAGPEIRTVAIAPGADVLARWLELPVGGQAQLKAAARWALKSEVASEPERTVFALEAAKTAGRPGSRLVCVVSLNLLEAWIDYLGALGVRPAAIVPDYLVLPAPDDDGLRSAAFGQDIALRGGDLAASVQPDLVEVVAQGRPVLHLDDAQLIDELLARVAAQPPVDLLSGLERKGKSRGGLWRWAAGLAAALLVSPLVLTLAEGARDQAAANRAERQSLALIEQRLPAAAQAPDPIAEARRLLAVSPPPGGLAPTSAALFAAVEKVEGAELDSLSADPAKGVRATLSYPAFEDLETIRTDLAAGKLSLTDESTIEDNGRIVSEVIVGGVR